jgi:hypothetical protein
LITYRISFSVFWINIVPQNRAQIQEKNSSQVILDKQ